ncbi:hypothetical protein DFR43_11412 [Tepidicella xavieri]|jgi:hypothetical protein|uniref:Uncharacterized protein n=1 Tax=Tepidicella xavieri TaxID=360241 RepID=A0A4V6PWI7_9BURK|nr:hypothetical protein DFR43_11412 [Tepidicella xavieri]
MKATGSISGCAGCLLEGTDRASAAEVAARAS